MSTHFNAKQNSNIWFISTNEEVSKLLKFKYSSLLQTPNIPDIQITDEVSKLDKSKLVKEAQL